MARRQTPWRSARPAQQPQVMTLRSKMGLQIGAMLIALLLISAAGLWGINAMHQDLGAAIAGYQELREVYETSSHVAAARTLLSRDPPDSRSAMREIQQAHFLAMHPSSPSSMADGQARRLRAVLQSELADAQSQWWAVTTQQPGNDPDQLNVSLNRVLGRTRELATEIRTSIQSIQQAADHKRRATMIMMAILSAFVIAGAVLIGILEYRGVMRPLRRLGEGVRRLAQGNLSQRIEPSGHAEFADLAAEFNRMAGELDELYRELERKVAHKSMELVRSERLASVGFLAAGVAHEINNPIGIIAGHAELTLRQLGENPGSAPLDETRRSLTVIAEEAFRCKQIVQKLLTLSRGGDESRAVISLGAVARSVVSAVEGLNDYRDRRIALDEQQGEMKQVLLNLTINALEATSPGGAVRIGVCRRDSQVELSVADNGRGMSGEMLERIFEPFYTAKRGAARPGTGLGLSITHAIVQSHGGQITAHSEGVGKGSRFVVLLPAARGGAS